MGDYTEWLNSIVNTLSSYFTWENIKALTNSSFFIALAGALAGALGGAYAAQRGIERARMREELTKEIRNTNGAIALASSIANAVLNAKEKHLLTLNKAFQKNKNDLVKQMQKNSRGETVGELVYQADLETLLPLFLPIETLRNQIFERLSINGRPLSAVIMAEQTLNSLNDTLKRHNQLIERFQGMPRKQIISAYFGLPLADGDVNSEYEDTLEALNFYANDIIFFCSLLCQDLYSHGQELLTRHKGLFRGEKLKINEANFTKARSDGLMPPEEDYAGWLIGFQKGPE